MSELKAFDSSKTKLEKGVTLLEASAGTGKTYALARIFLRLIAEEGVEVGKILTVTFTSAATEELRDRIRSLLVESHDTLLEEPTPGEDPTFSRLRALEGVSKEECVRRIKLSITCFDEAIISTIHGFCNRVLTENSFETQSLFEAELDKASKEMAMEGVQEYWREKFASAHPVVSASASTKNVNLEDMAVFFNGLPRTQEYELGFEEEVEAKAAVDSLIAAFDRLKTSWSAGQVDYADYVSNCLAKNARPKTNLERHSRILNQALLNDEPSPTGIEILDEMRASKLKPKREFDEREKPSFSEDADVFWSALESFGRAVRVDCVKYLERRIGEWKARRGLLFFDDLLSLTAQAVASKGKDGDALRDGLRESFEAALIDEFQDTDPVQFEIFRELFGETGKHWLYLIGDPKQSIYRFRGADLEAYFDFAQKTKAVKYSLDTNYRTVTPLVESINAFFSKSDEPFLHSELLFSPVNPNREGEADKEKIYLEDGERKPAFVIRALDWRKEKEPKADEARRAIRKDMANEIHRLLSTGTIGGEKVRAKDVAVLVRSNPDARKVWKYFRKRGLAAVVFTDVSLFESPEAKELLWVLEGLVNARNERAIKRALATGLLGMTSADFQSWQDEPAKWDEWVGTFREYHETWRKKGIYVAMRELFRKTRAIPRNLRRPDGERRVTNFLHLAEVLHQATSTNPLSPSSLVVWLRTRMEQSDVSNDEYQLRLESQSESIRILTVHKSKGLEYPIVFLPGLSFLSGGKGDDFKYHREDGKLVVDLKKTAGEDALSLGKREEEQEDARVLYVALTRSAARCYVYHAPVKISGKARVPAQVRMMRSWGSQAQSDESEDSGPQDGNAMSEAVEQWVAGLSGQADYATFTDEQADFVGEGNVESGNLEEDSLQAENWNPERKIPRAKIVESFSGLSKQVGFDGRDLDGISDGQDQQEDFLGEEKTPIFKFPAGATPGNFMHDVFEHLDFSDSSNWKGFIEDKLKQHQYDSKKWTPTILDMVEQVMVTELEPGLSLNKLEKADRMEEMEFHFPMAPGFLPELSGSLPEDSILKKYLVRLSREDYRRIEENGYLKGLVDLIFRANGKYYVLDWKSNKLSGRTEGFGDKEIEKEMLTHHYVLQYHLYVVAVHRFLHSRMKDYSYERNFGGVYYLFLRGMNVGSENGIYFDLPDLETVRILENFLVPGK